MFLISVVFVARTGPQESQKIVKNDHSSLHGTCHKHICFEVSQGDCLGSQSHDLGAPGAPKAALFCPRHLSP
jgi:hypothetical protein